MAALELPFEELFEIEHGKRSVPRGSAAAAEMRDIYAAAAARGLRLTGIPRLPCAPLEFLREAKSSFNGREQNLVR